MLCYFSEFYLSSTSPLPRLNLNPKFVSSESKPTLNLRPQMTAEQAYLMFGLLTLVYVLSVVFLAMVVVHYRALYQAREKFKKATNLTEGFTTDELSAVSEFELQLQHHMTYPPGDSIRELSSEELIELWSEVKQIFHKRLSGWK